MDPATGAKPKEPSGPKDAIARIRGMTVMQQCGAVSQEHIELRNAHIANTPAFQVFIGVMISVNAVMVGLEVDQGRGDAIGDRLLFFFAEIIFGGIFFVEMIMRQHMDGWNYFLDAWNLLDYHLVILGFIDICMSLLYAGRGDIKIVTAFRIIRMLRLVRNIRLLRMFRELWILVRGLYDALSSLAWISGLLAIAIYCVAIYVTISMGKEQQVHELWIPWFQYIGSIPKTMISLFQVVTFDQWATDIVRPIAILNPSVLVVVLILIVICSFGIMNVIIGVIVDRAMQIASENEVLVQHVIDGVEEKLMASLSQAFAKADDDGSAQLTQDEFCEALLSPEFTEKLHLLDMPPDDVEELFMMLDVDGSGTVSAEEFVQGVGRLRGAARGKDMIQLISFVNRSMRRVRQLCARVEWVNDKADDILGRLDMMTSLTVEELQDRKHASVRQQELQKKVGDKLKVLDRLERQRTLKFPRLPSRGLGSSRPQFF